MNPKLKAILYECHRTRHVQDKYRNFEFYEKELKKAGLYEDEIKQGIIEIRKILNMECK